MHSALFSAAKSIQPSHGQAQAKVAKTMNTNFLCDAEETGFFRLLVFSVCFLSMAKAGNGVKNQQQQFLNKLNTFPPLLSVKTVFLKLVHLNELQS